MIALSHHQGCVSSVDPCPGSWMIKHLLAFYRCSLLRGRAWLRAPACASLPLSQHAAALSSFTSTSSIVKKVRASLLTVAEPGTADRRRWFAARFEPRSLRLVKTFRTAVGLTHTHTHVTNWIESLFGRYPSAFPRTLDYPAKVGFCTSVITAFTI